MVDCQSFKISPLENIYKVTSFNHLIRVKYQRANIKTLCPLFQLYPGNSSTTMFNVFISK